MNKIAFIGDSITQNGLYIAFMREYFKQNPIDLELINLGKSSETVSGLSENNHPGKRPCVHERIDKILKLIEFDTAFVCYGMNDAIYHPYSDERFIAYRDGLILLINKLKSQGKKVILMTPPPFDKHSAGKNCDCLRDQNFNNFSYLEPYENYNEVLSIYKDWIVVSNCADMVIDINTPLSNYINEQIKQNPDFCAGDGIHPDNHEHWIIARTILKALFNITLTHEPAFTGGGEFINKHETDSAILREFIETGIKNGSSIKEPPAFPAESWDDTYKGYIKYNFYVNGCEGCVIFPENPLPGNPYIWRCEFLGAFDCADIALLSQGWHLVYYCVNDRFGSPKAVKLMSAFHEYIENEFGLAKKTVLFGFSRGGLYALNYTAVYPQKVSCVYLDAPVLNIFSWPGNYGNLGGHILEWKACKKEYGIEGTEYNEYYSRMTDNIKILLNNKIPVVLVAGGADEVVAFYENGQILLDLYKENGGIIQEIIKPTCKHHPHSLENPIIIIDFINKYGKEV